ncbi:hypothetical protein QYF36_007061 [Acer negundo]|nr:hypothetical protein QYF36_007061 [Acer negundo]
MDTLIDGFGMGLQHTLHRMKRWTMHLKPRKLGKRISKLEANIYSRMAQVLEVLEATNEEATKDYWGRVDFDMSMGPQFIPLIEMKEKKSSDDGGDGDDRAQIVTIPLKWKAPNQKEKKISVAAAYIHCHQPY